MPSDYASATWVRKVVDVVNNMLSGRLNVGLKVILNTSTTSTTIKDARISAVSALIFTPNTAHAAAILSSIFVSSQKEGEATLTHSPTLDIDCVFTTTIMG